LAEAGLTQARTTPTGQSRAGPIVVASGPAGTEQTGPADAAPVADTLTTSAGTPEPDRTELRERLARMPQPVFPLAGSDVLALGVTPGPLVGALLRAVRAWWLADGCTAETDGCRAELTRLIAQIDSPVNKTLENSPPSEQTGP
jgi:hypothetical protein